MSNTIEKPECCPKFDPAPWENQTVTWDGKRFVKDRVFTLFYIPINFGKVITRLMAKVEKAGAIMPDYLSLSDHTSKWNMDLYIAVDKPVDSAENVTLKGKFLTRVYEGPFKETGNWCKDFEKYAADAGHKVRKWYMWYTTCPKCAKKFGKNYVVIVGQVD
jgi:hypothetical protein